MDNDTPLTIPVEEVEQTEKRAILCFRHRLPHIMKPTSNTEKDGTVVKHYTCTKCYQLIKETPEIIEYLNGGIDMNKQVYG